MCFVEADRTSRTHVAKLPLAALCKKIRLHAKDQILGLGLHAISHLLVELSLDFFLRARPKRSQTVVTMVGFPWGFPET